jgi:hypothetical protein
MTALVGLNATKYMNRRAEIPDVDQGAQRRMALRNVAVSLIAG